MGLFGGKKKEVEAAVVTCAACGKQVSGQYTRINNTKTKELLYSLCPDCNNKFLTVTEKLLPYPQTPSEIKEIVDGSAFEEKRICCNVCGNVFCYSLKDVINNKRLAQQANKAQLRGALNSLATSQILGAQQQAEADRLKAQIVVFSHCPKCNSTDLKQLSEEEYKAAIAAKNAPAPAATSPMDELKKMKELLDMGIVTQEEFDAKKKQLLGL